MESAQRGLGHADGHAAIEVHAVALEQFVFRDLDKIYRSPGGPPRIPASPSPARRMRVPVSTPVRDVDRQARSFSTRPEPLAGFARVLDDLAQTRTGRAGAFNGKEALLRAHLAHAGTGRAGCGLDAAFGTGAVTGRTGDCSRDIDCFLQIRHRRLPASHAGCSAGPTRARPGVRHRPHHVARP